MSYTKKFLILGIVVVIIGALLYFAPTILTNLQSVSNSPSSSYNVPYTSLMLRDAMNYGTASNHTTTLDFGDTEYTFDYFGGVLFYGCFIGGGSQISSPHIGDVINDIGIEIRVSNLTTDYISNYIVILVKPTVQNYMASLHYTKVEITTSHSVDAYISSGLTNQTNHYTFTYYPTGGQVPMEPYIQIDYSGQSKQYDVVAGYPNSPTVPIIDFGIQIEPFKAEPTYAIIYVKPLY